LQGKVAMTKKPRVAWTPDLHARFVKAVTALGVDTAVPKQIMLVRMRCSAVCGAPLSPRSH